MNLPPIHRKNLNLAIAVTILLFGKCACAMPEDQKLPLNIVADFVQINHPDGLNIYKGNVHVFQGSTHLDADELRTRNDQNNQLIEVIATGDRAIYRTVPAINKPEFIAKANTIKYYPQQNKVILSGNAEALQSKNTFKGPVIEYNTKLQRVVSTSAQLGRSNIVIQPEHPPSLG